MRDRLISILEEARPDIDFENTENLIDEHILESFDMIMIVSEISDEFNIVIRPKELVPANFNSLDAMVAMIERIQGK